METYELVLSDIHVNKVCDDRKDLQLSRFKFCIPKTKHEARDFETRSSHQVPVFDQDGDFDIVVSDPEFDYDVIHIYHHMSTELSAVGLQVWRGALLMCDYIMENEDRFFDKDILELGCGTGLTSIVAGQYARGVVCTDAETAVLNLCKMNFQENSRLIKANCSIYVEELNWLHGIDAKILTNSPNIILIADCIYDNDLTDALFHTLQKLVLSPSVKVKPIILISLEKRLNFTLIDLDVTCREYDHFRICLQQFEKNSGYFSQSICVETLPHYFQYDRTKYVELWELQCCQL